MIYGIGVDILELERIEKTLQRRGTRFLNRIYTPDELGGAPRATASRIGYLTARFCGKEAVLKALGTGLSQGIRWTDVEIVKDQRGAPGVRLHQQAAAWARRRGIGRVYVSLSHAEKYAVAQAIAWIDGPEG